MKRFFILIVLLFTVLLCPIANANQHIDQTLFLTDFNKSANSDIKYWAQNFDTSYGKVGVEWSENNIIDESKLIKDYGCGLASAAMVLYPQKGEIFDKRLGVTASVVADPYSMYVANGNSTYVNWSFKNYEDKWLRIDLEGISEGLKANVIAYYIEKGHNPIGYWNYYCNYDKKQRMHFIGFLSHRIDVNPLPPNFLSLIPKSAFSIENSSDCIMDQINISPYNYETRGIIAPVPDGTYADKFKIHDPYNLSDRGGPDIYFKDNVHHAIFDRLKSIRILIKE